MAAFAFLLSAFPGERTGYTASGGTFGAYLGTLRRNGLVEVDGIVLEWHHRIVIPRSACKSLPLGRSVKYTDSVSRISTIVADIERGNCCWLGF
jgi:hypothetical protein